ncbi:MAG: hypothetical protein LBF80_04590 [Spirochaetaceae bacterium]|jgi:hypothetical protein|nr:hypothetical protein [Spirochaetaceae bacterium]
MTISEHVVLLKTGLLVSFLALAAFAVFAVKTFSLYPGLIAVAAERSGLLFTARAGTASYAAPVSVGLAVLFAVVTQILLYYFFEKTQSMEIRFFGIFLFSFVFEILRIALPVKTAFDISGYMPVIAFRMMIFGRFYGLLALLAAGLYASGLKVQREGAVIFTIAVVALFFAFRVPLDAFSYDTSLYPLTGFPNMFKMTNAALVLLTVFCFISGAYTRGVNEYYFTVPGILAAAAGRTLLFTSDTWLTLFSGLVLLVSGTWLVGNQLRRIYLWV